MDQLKNWIARIITFVIVFILFVYVINFWDADPLPGRILIREQPITGSDEHNLLYLFAGLNAPRGENPYRAGRQVIAYQRRQARSLVLHGYNFLLSHKPTYGMADPQDPSLKDVSVPFTGLSCRADCLRQYAAHRGTIEADLHRYGWLLQRLHQGYHDTYTDDQQAEGNPAGYSVTIGGSVALLEFARIGLLAVEGKRDQAIHALVAYDHFWRRLAAEAPTTFPRMVAMLYINRGIRLAADMARTLPLTQNQRTALGAMARPLPGAMLDFRDVAYSRYRLSDTLTLMAYSETFGLHNSGIISTQWWMTPIDILVRPLFQRQDFLNLQYRDYVEADEMAMADTTGLKKAIEKARADEHVRPAWDWIYDPLGKYENAVLRGFDFSTLLYVKAGAHNLDLKLMLLRLQLGARNAKALAHAAAKAINPVTHKSVHFDPKTGMLETDGFARQDGIPILGHLVRLYAIQTPATEEATEKGIKTRNNDRNH